LSGGPDKRVEKNRIEFSIGPQLPSRGRPGHDGPLLPDFSRAKRAATDAAFNLGDSWRSFDQGEAVKHASPGGLRDLRGEAGWHPFLDPVDGTRRLSEQFMQQASGHASLRGGNASGLER